MKLSNVIIFYPAVLLGFISYCQGANILFYFALSTYSHRITVWPLVEAMVDRGHSVTFLQPAKNKSPNPKVKEINPSISADDLTGNSTAELDMLQMRLNTGANGAFVLTYKLPFLGASMCEHLLNEPSIIKWISESHFDLVVVDGLYNDCGYGLAYKWKAKTIIFGTTSVFEWWPDSFGFPAETNWISSIHMGLSMPLSFTGRLLSTLASMYFRFTKIGIIHPKIEGMLREKLKIPDMPALASLESNISLILMNSHPSEELPRSLPPMVISVGGMHITNKTKPMTKEMEDFIKKGGNEGFIFVSFGSAAKIGKADPELRNKFFNAFKNIKKPILWKWEGPRPSDMPSNVFTADWMPQQAILAHPKIKAFVTHGGLMSIQEALFNAVPMITFPVFAEQDYNSERLHRTKRGIRLEITDFSQQDLEDALHKLLNDKIYSDTVKKDSAIFKDRPMQPLDTAIWWVEYVLRRPDTSYLRPLAVTQTWYEKRLLDVWGFLFLVLSLQMYVSYRILKMCCCRKKSESKNLSSSKKTKVKKN